MLIFRRVLAVAPCLVVILALVTPSTPMVARVAIATVGLVTLFDPVAGLLLLAVSGPLGSYLAELLGIGQFRLTEAIVLSFVCAWLLQRPARNQGPRLPRYAVMSGWLFGVLVVSLTIGVSSQLFRYPNILRTTQLGLAESYFSYSDLTGITAAARVLEGMAIAMASIELFRQRPSLARSLPAALALSAAAGALTGVLLWLGLAPHRVLLRHGLIGDARFVAHIGDLNAAGTHFAMVLCLSLGMSMREHGPRRRWWIAATLACALGLWMSGSRSAEAAVGFVIPAAALWAATVSWPRTRRLRLVAGVLGVLLAVAGVVAWRTEQNALERNAPYSELGFRQQFVMSSFRIIGTHPYFGIGAGQYYNDAPLFLTPQLAWTYGSENAHNNFLQITTETGIIGFALFAAWFAGGLQLAVSALASAPRDGRLLGAAGGIVAFLGTCLGGHPLVVPEVALAVFLQFALMAGLGASSELNRAGAATEAGRPHATPVALWRILGAVGTLVLGILPALSVAKPNAPVHLEEVDGLYYEQKVDEAGVPFRWTRKYASIFVPATAKRVELTMRAPAGTPGDRPVRVDITSSGVALPPALVADAWKTVTVELIPPQPPLMFNRINLKSDSVSLDDGRPVGIRVSDIRIARIAWEVMPGQDALSSSVR
jgi:O-antigen ligase